MFKIIISAHEFMRDGGSECHFAYEIIRRLSEKYEIILLTTRTNQIGTISYEESNNKNQILLSKIRIHYIDYPLLAKLICKISRVINSGNLGFKPLYFLNVNLWEKQVLKTVKIINKSEKIDIIHHFNHISFREPGYLHLLSSNFVMGPVSGVGVIPKKFINKLSISEKILNYARNASNYYSMKLSIRLKVASIKAKAILCVTDEDRNFFNSYSKNTHIIPDVGVSFNNKKSLLNKRTNIKEKIDAYIVGRIDQLKGIEIILDVFKENAELREKYNLHVIGDGKLRSRLIKEYSELKMVKWHGRIEHSIIKSVISEFDLLIHPSIKEATSLSIIESLEIGNFVICHNAFGIKNVEHRNLIKVKFHSYEHSKAEFLRELRNFNLPVEKFYETIPFYYLDNISNKIDKIYQDILK